MSKAYELGCIFESRKSEATTTIPVYTWVRLCTTQDSVDRITTRGTVYPYGVTMEAINPGDTGKVAIDGICRVKMGSTARTTMYVTTPQYIGANADGKGVVLTTSHGVFAGAIGLSTFAASDIVAVKLLGFPLEPNI